MEAQRQLDKPELSGLDPVWADLRLIEPDLAWFPPGEDVNNRQKPITPASSDLEELLSGRRRAGEESGVQG